MFENNMTVIISFYISSLLLIMSVILALIGQELRGVEHALQATHSFIFDCWYDFLDEHVVPLPYGGQPEGQNSLFMEVQLNFSSRQKCGKKLCYTIKMSSLKKGCQQKSHI